MSTKSVTFGQPVTEGKMVHKVFNVGEKTVTKKMVMKLLNKEYVGLDPKTFEFQKKSKPLDAFMAQGGTMGQVPFSCDGTDPRGGGSYHVWGYIRAGVRASSTGVEVEAHIVIDV